MYKNKKHKLEILRSQLDLERSSFIGHWRELSEYIHPRRSRFTISDANRGDKRSHKIIDSTATLAARTLRAGMMSGITSPARPWFKLTTTDPDMADYQPVKEWLHYVTNTISTSYLRSNLYNVLPSLYGDLGSFGTSPIIIQEDFNEVFHAQLFPVGSYMVAQDYKGKINVFFREFRLTVRQLVEMFGEIETNGKVKWDNFSSHVKNQWDQCNYEAWIDVCHVIMPNENYNPKSIKGVEKKFSSFYYERGSSGYSSSYEDDVFLRQSGYDVFPVLCPRWEVVGEDVYGTDCPGMTALPDIKQLQTVEKRAAQAIEKMVNPPMVGPTSMKNAKASILPGDITYMDVRDGLQGFRPAHEVRASIQELENKQAQVRDRIRRAFFEDLFLMLASSDRRMITAREIEERHEEKLLALGPVLEQLNQDLLDPLIDLTFDIHMRQGYIPPPPKEIQGQALKVEYVSIMAQAQKAVGLVGVDRFASFSSQLLSVAPETKDKLIFDQFIDVYADITGVPPTLIRSDEDAQKIREERAQAAAQQQQMQMMQQSIASAKDLSQASLDSDNVLTRALGVSG